MDVFAGDLRTYIIGEHGDSSLATLGHATIGGMKLDQMIDVMGVRREMPKKSAPKQFNCVVTQIPQLPWLCK